VHGYEVLFCQQLQKSTQKKAALITSRKRFPELLKICGVFRTRSYLAQTGEIPEPQISALLGLLKGLSRGSTIVIFIRQIIYL